MSATAILHYGMRAGLHGPDVISANTKDGGITVWDSKARGWPKSIGTSTGAHQGSDSLRLAWDRVKDEVRLAVESGRIPPEAAQKALENAEKGNFLINTIGTDKAHGGVVMRVQNGTFSDDWSD